MALKIDVVVVTFNGAPWIRSVLDSVLSSEYPCRAIVVDNASEDETAAIVESEYPSARLIRSPENLGFGRGNNLGIRHALDNGSDYIFLLNQDALLLPDTIGCLVSFMLEHPEYGVVSPLHCSAEQQSLDPATQRAYFNQYAPKMFSDSLLGRLQPYYRLHGVNAAAWLVSRRCFESVGGFDPLFFMYGEDDDLLDRIAYHQFLVAVVTGTRIIHLRAKTPRPKTGFFQSIWLRSDRLRAARLVWLKKPNHSVSFKLQYLIVVGVMQPALDTLIKRDLKELLANWIAVGRLLAKLRSVLRSVAACRQVGPHFLAQNSVRISNEK